MTSEVFPDTSTPFGQKVHDRLRDDRVIWLTTVSADGTPQPNPVWFVRVGDDVLIYNDRYAKRLAALRDSSQVALHLNSDEHGGDVVVLTGRAETDEHGPLPHESPEYLAKYRADIEAVSGSPEAFAQRYSVPTVVRITRIRGF